MEAAPAAAPPQLSPDGQWWWDGHQWLPTQRVCEPALPAQQTVLPAQQTVLPAPPGGGPSTYPWVAAPPPSADRLAIASLVLGLLWLLGLGSIAAVILGHASRRRAAREGRRPSGVALGGLVVGYAGFAFALLGVLAAVAIPAFLHQRQVAAQAVVAQAEGVPAAIEAEFGGSPFTPEQFGRTVADLEAHRLQCAPTAGADAGPAALTYAAIQYDTHFEETLLSWSLTAKPGPSTPEERAEMVRLDRKKVAAIQASPDLAPVAARLTTAMQRYDDLLALSLDQRAWEANADEAHALSAHRGAAAVELRATLGLGGGRCMVYRP